MAFWFIDKLPHRVKVSCPKVGPVWGFLQCLSGFGPPDCLAVPVPFPCLSQWNLLLRDNS